MLIKTVLRCLIVVGSDQEQTVRSKLLRLFGHHHGMRCIIGAGTMRYSALCNFCGKTNRFQMFRVIQRRRFAGSPDHDQSICSVFDLILDQSLH